MTAFNLKTLQNPLFRTGAVAFSVYDKIRSPIYADALPENSPLRRLNSAQDTTLDPVASIAASVRDIMRSTFLMSPGGGEFNTPGYPAIGGGRGPNGDLPKLYQEGGSGSSASPTQGGEVRVRVDFSNLPMGAKVDTQSTGTLGPPDMNVGYGFPIGAY